MDDPGDRFGQWRSGEGAWVGPVIPAGRQQTRGLEGAQGCPCVLRDGDHRLRQCWDGAAGGTGREGTALHLYYSHVAFVWLGGKHDPPDKGCEAEVVTFGNSNEKR